MAEQVPVEAIVAAFTTPEGAANALAELKSVDKNVLHIREAAVLVRDANNELRIEESHHVAKGAVVGGIAGAVIGLGAGPVGWVTVGGAAVGALANRLRDTGFPDERLKRIGGSLTPGTSGLVAVVEHQWVADLEGRLRTIEADVATEEVRADVAAQLEESGTGSPPARPAG